MERRVKTIFHRLLLVAGSIWLFLGLVISPTASVSSDGDIILTSPMVTGNSVETCLNSRFSFDGVNSLVSPADNQQLSNVVWAAGRAPMIGLNRSIYVNTRDGKYLYNPSTNTLNYVNSTVTDKGAFKISWDIGQNGLIFDAGLIYMPSLLASVSLWSTAESMVSSPKVNDIVFGSQTGMQLQTEVAAHCSLLQTDVGWLPDPSTNGSNQLENVLTNLKYTSSFSQTNLTLQQISQLLWAGYGCTPHEPTTGLKGLTVPSAIAKYYLTGTIYLVNENGVFRYQNRLPTDNFTFSTRDHRLDQLGSSDIRASIRSAVNGLPQAPTYIVLSFDDARLAELAVGYPLVYQWATLETGFVSFNYLLQASTMGLGANFKTQLTSGEQSNIQTVTGIPIGHSPQVIVSLGSLPTSSSDYIITTTLYSGIKPSGDSTHTFDLDMVKTVSGPKTTKSITTGTLWGYSEAAQTNVAFGTSTWKIHTHCNNNGSPGTVTGTLYIVNADGSYTQFASQTATVIGGSNNIDLLCTPSSNVTFTSGQRIGVRWSWIGSGALDIYINSTHIDSGDSGVELPSTDPGFPTPEVSTILLVGIGILVIAGFVWYKRRKSAVRTS